MIQNLTAQTVLASSVEMAQTTSQRMKGLLGRDSMEPNSALVITGCQSIHMFFMKFAIDVVFVDKNNTVVGLCPHIKPFELSPIFFKSSCAIELPAGTIELSKTQVGHSLQLN